MPLSMILQHDRIDISKSIINVKNSKIRYAAVEVDYSSGEDDSEDDVVDDQPELEEEPGAVSEAEATTQLVIYEDMEVDAVSEPQPTVLNARPETETTQTLQGLQTLQRESDLLHMQGVEKKFRENLKKGQYISHLVPSGSLILHSNRHTVHLLPTNGECPPTKCNNILRQDFPHDTWFPRPISVYDRINMLATIPELSLVLVASQVGRVALITITRPVDRYNNLKSFVSMRVELILPFANEETKLKIRPSCGLLGMAVGPMQPEEQRLRGGMGPNSWRLMLHYYNHAILSYEISRDKETQDLLIC
jgi:hypothetical protein